MPEDLQEADSTKPGRRPFGVTVLAGFGVVSSALIAAASLSSFYQIGLFLIRSPKSDVADVALGAYVVVPLAWVSLVTLGWIAFTAGVDLWRMRARGRKLTMIAMSLIFLLGVMFVFVGFSDDPSFASVGVVLCLVGSFSMVYLLLPAVRSRFQE